MTKWKKLNDLTSLRTLYSDDPTQDTPEPEKMPPRASGEPTGGIKSKPGSEPKGILTRKNQNERNHAHSTVATVGKLVQKNRQDS